jgi:hypothetical protein
MHDPAAELRAHLAEVLHIDTLALQLEPLRAARHGVTFRNITLLPFLVRVPRLSKLPRTQTVPLVRLGNIPVSSATRKVADAALR